MPFIDFHTHKSEAEENSIDIKNIFPLDSLDIQPYGFRLYSVGLHPAFINERFEIELSAIRELSNDKRIVVIGETGLDRLVKTDFKLQEDVFHSHLEIAQKANKPVIIHCVRAYPEIIKILKKLKVQVPVIIHGFNANLQITKELIKNGFYFSLGHDLLKAGSNAAKSIKILPAELLLLETDDKNISIREIYQKASEILNIPVDSLMMKIYFNFSKIIS